MSNTPTQRDDDDRRLAGAKGEGGEGTDPAMATTTDSRFGDTPEQALGATAGEARQTPDNRLHGLGGGYGGQGAGPSGNALAGGAPGVAGGAAGNPAGAYDFPDTGSETAQARALASAAGQPGLAAPRDEKREQAGGETPAKE
jgi:hypothetical protein